MPTTFASGLNLRTGTERPNLPKAGSRKPNPLMSVVIIAVLLLAAIGIFKAVGKARTASNEVSVVISNRDLLPGTPVDYSELRYVQVPKRFTTKHMFTSSNQVVGKLVRSFVPAGEPIYDYCVFPNAEALSNNLAPNERAVALRLDSDQLVDHYIQPDDRVDVVVSTDTEGKKFTKTLCQGVRVLIAPTKRQTLSRLGKGDAARTITLAVQPNQVEEINEAVEVGKIRLSLCPKMRMLTPTLFGSQLDDCLPHFAIQQLAQLKHEKEQPAEKAETTELPLPPVASQELATALPAPNIQDIPVAKWLVEIFSGSKRYEHVVPQS